MKKTRLATLATILGLVSAAPARAAVVFIDSYDNALAPDGYYTLLYPNHYQASEFRDGNGVKSDADFKLDLMFLRAVVYKHVNKIPLGFQVILPVGNLDENKFTDGGGAPLRSRSSGVGDTIFGPGVFLYANEKSATTVSYWFYAYAPTGAFSRTSPINLGTNHWYFEHQLALNQVIQKKLVVDANVNVYHHTDDRDTDSHSALRFELAAIAGYQFTDKLLAGLHGGAYWDLEDGRLNGAVNPAGRKYAVGPALSYQWTQKFGTTVRYTRDVSARNDFVGNDFWLRGSYAF